METTNPVGLHAGHLPPSNDDTHFYECKKMDKWVSQVIVDL